MEPTPEQIDMSLTNSVPVFKHLFLESTQEHAPNNTEGRAKRQIRAGTAGMRPPTHHCTDTELAEAHTVAPPSADTVQQAASHQASYYEETERDAACTEPEEALENTATQNSALKVTPNQFSHIIKVHWPQPTAEAWIRAPFHTALYYDVRASGLPNYMSVKREVPSQLKCDNWDKYLKDYHDAEMVQFLRYGWPVTYTVPLPPRPVLENHASATRHAGVVKAFIAKELDKNALIGPFAEPPFTPWTQTSPLMTRDKPDGSGKRVIVDLSFPEGQSVNDGIRRNFVQGTDCFYSLLTAWDLATLILQEGKGAYMWKSDLSRAYRQLRVDPLDYPLLGILFEGEYLIDICPSFGCRASGGSQQRFCGIASTLDAAVEGLAEFQELALDP